MYIYLYGWASALRCVLHPALEELREPAAGAGGSGGGGHVRRPNPTQQRVQVHRLHNLVKVEAVLRLLVVSRSRRLAAAPTAGLVGMATVGPAARLWILEAPQLHDVLEVDGLVEPLGFVLVTRPAASALPASTAAATSIVDVSAVVPATTASAAFLVLATETVLGVVAVPFSRVFARIFTLIPNPKCSKIYYCNS